MIRLLHAADLHLDSPFEGLREEKAAKRRAELRELPRRIAALAVSEGAQLMLLSGDLFDSSRAYAETGEELCAALRSLDIPVFISPGNHDWYAPGGRWDKLELPENVHVFKGSAVECVELPELQARVYGAAFTDASSPGLLRGFRAERSDGCVSLMCLHGDALTPGSTYGPVTEAEIAASGLNYLALGHIHTYSGARRSGDTVYAWPGCPEGRGFDETGDKGVIIADVNEHGAEPRFVSVCSRRYESLRADASKPLEGLCERDLYSITLTGVTDAPLDFEALRRGLEERVFSLRLKDETRPREGLWARVEEDTLRGGFLRRLRAEYDAAETEAERERIVAAVRWGLAALDGREEATPLWS